MMASPVDPGNSAPLALSGRVATMDGGHTVLDDGVIYARNGSITDVLPAGAPVPPGYENVPRISTGGTIFPGLVELHNHLPYDVLSLWSVPRLFRNRDQWSGPSTADYNRLISGPMGVLGRDVDVVPAVVRYVEVRCLLGGTTTSQGVALASDPGIVTHFRGLVRNVESTGDPQLPPAATHIADVDATDAEHFLARISGRQKLILHLAEGTDSRSRDHFQALQLSSGTWAVTPNLIGIHCVALDRDDFDVFASHGGSMVWSPLSNLLLYGKTADLGAARAAGVPIALGSDWAPSGSKNLLGELKVARLAAPAAGADVAARDLVEMATTTPARMLGWEAHIGSLESGKRADLIVVDGMTGDPYDALVDATEAAITLVVINGVPRCGTNALMSRLGVDGGEQIDVGGHSRVINLVQPGADPAVEALSVTEAIERLEHALAALPDAVAARHVERVLPSSDHPLLAVAGVIDNHMSSSPHLPLRGRLTGPDMRAPATATSAAPLPALTLDPLTTVDDPAYYQALGTEANLPGDVRDGLAVLGSD
jgi:5-methylthioadenosine/S-adenosylhomocysteine deaminase